MGADSRAAVMDLQALYAHCGLPSDCQDVPAWDGQPITIIGYVDPHNIFQRDRYPGLPFEKFALNDRQGRTIEIWPQASHTDQLFRKLNERPADLIIVRGHLAAFKMQAGTGCVQGLKVLIHDHQQIDFVTE